MPIPSGGVPVSGYISPLDTADGYPVTDPVWGIDGLRSVANITERDAISAQRKREGMMVKVRGDLTGGEGTYVLNQDGSYTPLGRRALWDSKAIGVIIDDHFQGSSLSGSWAVIGAATWTVSGSKASPTASITGFFNNRIDYSGYYSCLEKWEAVADIILPSPLPSPGSLPNGVAAAFIGLVSKNTGYEKNIWGGIEFDTGSGVTGKLSIFSNESSTLKRLADASVNLSCAAGHSVRLRLCRSRNHLCLIAHNLTNQSISSISVKYGDTGVFTLSNGASAGADTITVGQAVAHNTGFFSIATSGGAWSIDRFTVMSGESMHPDICAIGDSITYGMSDAVEHDYRWQDILGKAVAARVSTYAGSGDRTGEVILRIGEIVNRRPKVAVLFIGTNDVSTSVALSTIQSNMAQIESTLTSIGIRTIWLTPLPRTGVATKALRDWMADNSGFNIVDPHPHFGLPSAAVRADLIPDGTHPNKSGHEIIANLVAQNL